MRELWHVLLTQLEEKPGRQMGFAVLAETPYEAQTQAFKHANSLQPNLWTLETAVATTFPIQGTSFLYDFQRGKE